MNFWYYQPNPMKMEDANNSDLQNHNYMIQYFPI